MTGTRMRRRETVHDEHRTTRRAPRQRQSRHARSVRCGGCSGLACCPKEELPLSDDESVSDLEHFDGQVLLFVDEPNQRLATSRGWGRTDPKAPFGPANVGAPESIQVGLPACDGLDVVADEDPDNVGVEQLLKWSHLRLFSASNRLLSTGGRTRPACPRTAPTGELFGGATAGSASHALLLRSFLIR